MMLSLIIASYIVFLVLWIADIYFTYKGVSKLGNSVEVNPLLRGIMNFRRRFLGIFKIAEISLFSYLIWQLSILDDNMVFNLLLVVILVYSLVVAAGIKVYIDAVGNSMPVVIFLFLICVIMVLFMFVAREEHISKSAVVDSLIDCNDAYANIYYGCNLSNSGDSTTNYSKYVTGITIPR